MNAAASLTNADAPRKRMRVSVRQLLLFVSVYAVLFGIYGLLPLTHKQWCAAVGIVTLFVLFDAWRGRAGPRAAPNLPRWVMCLAYYSTALAASGLAVFLILVNMPPPPVPPRPPMPFLVFLLELFSGNLVQEILQAVAKALVLPIMHLSVFWFFSTLALIASLFAVRHFRSAKWLALVNLPGVVWHSWFVIVICLDAR